VVAERIHDRRGAEVAVATDRLSDPSPAARLVGLFEQPALGACPDEQALDQRRPARQTGLDRSACAKQYRQALRRGGVGD
jgi:hypothetical protein